MKPKVRPESCEHCGGRVWVARAGTRVVAVTVLWETALWFANWEAARTRNTISILDVLSGKVAAAFAEVKQREIDAQYRAEAERAARHFETEGAAS